MSQDQFRHAEEEYFRLKGQFAVERITQQQFQAALEQLMIRDSQGRFWAMGVDTAKWYVHNGQTWVEAIPPAPAAYVPTPQPSRGSNRMLWIVAAGCVMVCLVGALGLVLATSQGVAKISLGQSTNTPSPTFVPVIPTIPTVPPTVALPTPLPPVTIAQPSPTVPAPTPTAQSTPTASSNRITFKFDVGVTQSERDEIQKGVALVQQRLGDVGPLQVYASDNLENLLAEANGYYQWLADSPDAKNVRQHFTDGSWGAFANKDAFWIRIGKAWRSAAPQYRLRLMAHEYFHGVQAYVSKKVGDDQAPLWLREGSAEYEAAVLAAESGLVDLARMRQQKADRSRGVLNMLNTMETLKGAEAEDTETPYTVGYLAVDYLASTYGNPNGLTKYWQARATTVTWQDAFKTAFGITPSEFYAKFEDYRRAQFAPYCGTVGETATSTLRVTYVRQFAPGALAFDYWSSPPPSDALAYVFCVKGYPLATTNWTTVTQVLKFPKDATLDSCGGSCWILYIPPASPAGTLALSATLPDGQRDQANFQHPSGVAGLAPTPIPPPPTPPLAPGMYITNLRMEPPNPGHSQDVGFYATFLNTANGDQTFKWAVYIFKVDDLRKSFGETAAVVSTVPSGSAELKSLGAWYVGVSICDNFVARVGMLDQNKNITWLNRTTGQIFEFAFRVC